MALSALPAIGEGGPEEWAIFGTGFGLAVLGLSFIFLYFMQRGKQRLNLVNNLRSALAEHEETFEHDKEQQVRIDANEYYRIAEIEREQIISDRQRSISLYSKKALRSEFVIQQSREVRATKANLDKATAALVGDQILQLTTDPRPSGSTEDPDTGTIRLPVPETAVEIEYQVDKDDRRIRVIAVRLVDVGVAEIAE